MIFHRSKKASNNLKVQNSEAGVSLILAILILSAVTAIAFSLATIVFIEIRSAGDSARTEPALYATLGVTEEAMFQYKRFYENPSEFNVPTCTPEDQPSEKGYVPKNVCSINGVTLTMPGTQPIQFDDSPGVITVDPMSTKTFPLYLPNSFDQQFLEVILELLPNNYSVKFTGSFSATYVDGTTDDGGCAPFVLVVDVPVSCTPGPSGQYELVLTNPSENQTLAVKVSTKRVDGSTPSGLPFVGEQVLRINANYLGLTRTYQVRIPIP